MPLDAVREAEAVGALLVKARRLTPERLDAARREAAGKGGRLATVLYAMGAIDLGALTRALAEAHGVEAIPPERMSSLDPAVVRLLPPRVCLRSLAVPVRLAETGLDVAFVDPADEPAVRDVTKAAGRPVNVAVAAEPLVYYALRVHGISARAPAHLAPLVDELVSTGLSSAPKRAPVPEPFEEFHTTPLGGVAPHSPDEITTAALLDAGTGIVPPDEILAGREDTFPAVEAALDAADGPEALAAVLVRFAVTGAAATAVLARSDSGWAAIAAAGTLREREIAMPADRPTVLTAALAGETGYRGPVPPGSATLALFEGRTPREILLLPLTRTAGAELLLHAESGAEPFGEVFVERLRTLARRARNALE